MSRGVEQSEPSKRKRGREQNENEQITTPKRQRHADVNPSIPIKSDAATPVKSNELQLEEDAAALEEHRLRRKEAKKARKRLLQQEKHELRVLTHPPKQKKQQQKAQALSPKQKDSNAGETKADAEDISIDSAVINGKTVAGAPAADDVAVHERDSHTSKKSKKQKKNQSKVRDAASSKDTAARAGQAETTDIASLPTTTASESTSKVIVAPAPNSQVSKKTLPAQQSAQQPNKPWSLSARQGGRYIDQDPVFTSDQYGSECLVTAQGDALQILSVKDSLIAKTLTAKAGRRIVSFHAVSTEQEDLVRVLYDDDTLIDWDWIAGSEEESKLISASVNIYRLAPLENRIASIYATWNEHLSHLLLDGIRIHTIDRQVIDIRVFNGANIIVALCQKLLVIGRRNTSDDVYTWVELDLQQAALCFDVRLCDTSSAGKKKPQQAMSIAIGYADGKIHMYSNVLSLFSTSGNPSLPIPRVLHWHRNAVAAVKFSEDGSYVISGGKETVLVIWQLETGQKSFLPNLTAEIERIVVNPVGDRYAIQLGDNSIMVLSTSELKPVAYFVGLQMAAYTQGSINGPQKLAAVLHPARKNELLLTVPASQPRSEDDSVSRPFLQTFGTSIASFSNRQALARNNVTDFNASPAQVPIVSPDAKLLAISPDGQWLASVDEWTPPSHDIEHINTTNEAGEGQEVERQEVYLKFWQWHAGTAKWNLNSRVDGPHSANHEALAGTNVGSVFRLLSMPSKTGFVTIGQDCKVKMWIPKRRFRHGELLLDSTGELQVEWTCEMTAELEVFDQREDMEMEGDRKPLDATLAISEDESLIAAALTSTTYSASYYNETVHFINTSNGKIRAGNHSIAAPGLLELAFADRSLIALSPRVLRVWDVVEDMLQASINIPVGDDALLDQIPLFALNKLDNAAIVASPGYLTVFQLQTPQIKSRLQMQQSIAAVLAVPRERGFLIVFDDATVCTLSQSSSPATVVGIEAIADADVTNALAATSKPHDHRNGLLGAKLAVRAGGDTQAAMVEDDRRVVRPEEVAKIFDEGPDGVALPSVKEMFHAVAGLFGRKPSPVGVHT